MSYDLSTIRGPILRGSRLRFAARLLESRLLGPLLAHAFLKQVGVAWFRRLRLNETPTWYPLADTHGRREQPIIAPGMELARKLGEPQRPSSSWAPPSAIDYARAYRSGECSPIEVGENIVRIVTQQQTGTPAHYALTAWNADWIRADAKESADRLAAGTARSILEGVPIAVKEELDVSGHPTTLGTAFRTDRTADRDAEIVARLRAAGALIVGKTNMHEIGIGVTGLNEHHGTPVNPHAPWRYPGGSSSGSASVVASGLCPIALGADGGGSVRIPAAYCGVYGLKPTYGRTSSRGEAHLARTVGSPGPIAATARDLALAYLAICGPDPSDPLSLHLPEPDVSGFRDGMEGVTIGVYRAWFEHADPEIVVRVRALVDGLRELGARIVEIEIPELEALRVAHLITITSEMRSAMEHEYRAGRRRFGNEARANLAPARFISTTDYIKAQQVRTRAIDAFARLFERVDIIATPTTANLPPVLHGDRFLTGVSDLESLSETMRFTVQANMVGLPAVSVPAGYVEKRSRPFGNAHRPFGGASEAGVQIKDSRMAGAPGPTSDGAEFSLVPVGAQFIAARGMEALLLRTAAVAEEIVPRPRPRVFDSPFFL